VARQLFNATSLASLFCALIVARRRRGPSVLNPKDRREAHPGGPNIDNCEAPERTPSVPTPDSTLHYQPRAMDGYEIAGLPVQNAP